MIALVIFVLSSFLRGYAEADIAKLWSGNLLRVMDEVQQVARDIQAGKR